MAIGATSALNAYREAISRLNESSGAGGADQADKASGGDFTSMLRNMANSAVETGKTAEKQTAAAAAGQADLNSVVMAVSEAELTLNTVVSVRDKVIDAYNQILRMPI